MHKKAWLATSWYGSIEPSSPHQSPLNATILNQAGWRHERRAICHTNYWSSSHEEDRPVRDLKPEHVAWNICIETMYFVRVEKTGSTVKHGLKLSNVESQQACKDRVTVVQEHQRTEWTRVAAVLIDKFRVWLIWWSGKTRTCRGTNVLLHGEVIIQEHTRAHRQPIVLSSLETPPLLFLSILAGASFVLSHMNNVFSKIRLDLKTSRPAFSSLNVM